MKILGGRVKPGHGEEGASVMKNILRIALLALFLAAPAAAQTAPALNGDWDGALAVQAGTTLRLSLHVETTATGQSAKLVSVDQGGAIVPVSAITKIGSQIIFNMPSAGATFQALLSTDSNTLFGSFTQGGVPRPLSLARRAAGAIAPVDIKRPQEPQRPFPYREEDVVYPSAGGAVLAGTLSLPEGSGKFPAVLLIGGSGPNNRDEGVFGHKPFLLLADYLTRRGIAVLRVDKRGIGKSTGNFSQATSADFATDVKAGVALLKARRDIGKIGLLGHSEGGEIAPMVAADDPSIAFVVLMAGPGVRGDVLMPMQIRRIGRADGISDSVLDFAVSLTSKRYAAIESASDTADAIAKQRAVLIANSPVAGNAVPDLQLAATSSPWYRFFLAYDPAPALARVKCPVLALNGDKDLQVDAVQNLTAIKAALSGNKDATIMTLPGLNHLFQTAKTGSPSEYVNIEETIAPSVLATIGDWIVKHTR